LSPQSAVVTATAIATGTANGAPQSGTTTMSSTVRTRLWTLAALAALPALVATSGPANAADQKEAIEKIKAHNQAATSAYGASDFEEMKTRLMEALAIGNESGLAKSKIIAQTYVLLGVLQVDGFKDGETGMRFFAKALAISPSATVPQGMATKGVKAAFKKAEEDDTGAVEEPDMSKLAKKGKGKDKDKDRDKDADRDEAPAAEAPSKGKSSVESMAEKRRAAEKAAEEKKQAEAERKEREKLVEDLAASKVSESTAAAERERLKQEKLDREKQLGDSKGRLQQLEKDKAERDKWLADTKAKLEKLEQEKPELVKQLNESKARAQQLEKDKAERDKWLAQVKDSDNKERAAKEAALKDKAELQKQLADAKGKIQQLEKDKAERDKWLAQVKDSEKKEREQREKAEHVVQEAAAREKERRGKEEEERKERQREWEGPDLPGHIGEPIHCTTPDELPAGFDLYVHCVPQPGNGAKVVSFYYRTSGAVVYNALTLEKSKKGWYAGMIPGGKIAGKLFQYYVEARDGSQKITATNGKANSPNIATIKLGGAKKK